MKRVSTHQPDEDEIDLLLNEYASTLRKERGFPASLTWWAGTRTWGLCTICGLMLEANPKEHREKHLAEMRAGKEPRAD